ncbi:MAG TPA: hypothetical protein VFB06_16690 [Streptosporangiaceae bacterium]|nr:hypothetical protein [Streptosporangiaceae bacterium]
MPKPAWIAVIAATFIGGAVAWLIVRQPVRGAAARLNSGSRWDIDDALDDDSFRWTDADDAVARHPAGRSRGAEGSRIPKGPDDDPDFLRVLDRVIRGSFETGEDH